MAGSSGMQFARIAAKQGIVGKRQLASWGFEHFRYRLRGTTDERTAEVLKVARELIRGVPERTIDRMGPEVMAAILPRVFPQMLEEVYAHQDAGRPTFIVSAAGNGVVEQLAHVLGMDGGIGTRYEVDAEGAFTGRLDGPFVYGEGKVRRCEEFADRARDRAGRVLRLLRLALRPADAARGRQPGRRQPRPAAGRDRPRGGLADAALRAPRPPPRRPGGDPAGDRRRLRRHASRRPPPRPAAAAAAPR